MAVTDGAGASQVDPGGRESAWESVLAEGISSTGIDPSAPFDASDDPAGSPPPPEANGVSGASEGAGTSGSPAAPAISSTPAARGDDGALKAAATPAPAVASSKPTSDPTGQAPAAPDTDPLAGAQPFTYTVGDETRTMDGAFRIPGEGLYVPEDKVPQFELMASRADTLDRQNRELYDRHSTLERATAWRTKDAQGNEQVVTGVQAAEQWRLAAAQMSAKAFEYERTFEAMVKDPTQFAKLYAIVTDEQGEYGPAGQQYVVPNPQGFEDLKRTAQTFARETALNMREQFPKVIAAPPPPEPTVADLAGITVKQVIKDYKIDGLTESDQTFLAGQLERYVQQTPQGRVVNPAFVEVVKDRAALRAEQAKAASAAESAGKFNTGMNRGRQQPRPAAPSAPAAPAAKPEKVGKQAQWNNVLQSALQEIGV